MHNDDLTKKDWNFDQLIHELDSATNFLKKLTQRRVDQDTQAKPPQASPRLFACQSSSSAPQAASSTPQYTGNLLQPLLQGKNKTKSTTPHQCHNTKPNSARPQSRPANSKRFVIDLQGCEPRRLPIHEVQDAMTNIMECTSARVAAVKYTENGNLAVSVTSANAAIELTSPHQWLRISKYIHDNFLQHEPPHHLPRQLMAPGGCQQNSNSRAPCWPLTTGPPQAYHHHRILILGIRRLILIYFPPYPISVPLFSDAVCCTTTISSRDREEDEAPAGGRCSVSASSSHPHPGSTHPYPPGPSGAWAYPTPLSPAPLPPISISFPQESIQ